MATTRPTNRTLAIIGSGANMATGNLIYMCGGMDLPMLAKLQEKGIRSYDKAAEELKSMNEELYFYTPRYMVTVKDQISSAGGLLLVVTPPPQATDPLFRTSTVHELKELAPLFAQKKAVILVNTPESHDWSEGLYNDLVHDIESALQHLGISAESIPIIPSDLQGQNFIEPSPKTFWYTNPTLVTALDDILS